MQVLKFSTDGNVTHTRLSVEPIKMYSRMLRHSCCEVRVMQLHDILQLRTSVILPEAISDGGLAPTTDTSLFLTTYRTPLKKWS